MSDIELFARQDALQAQAADVIADLDLFALLGTIGEPVQTGSSALGLMVARDIDVTTLCSSLEPTPVFDIGRRLAAHPRVRGLTFRNDTGRWNTDARYVDGLYWMVGYLAEPDIAWKLDLWFLRDGTTQFDLEHLKVLPTRLTGETRAAILAIKEALAAEPSRAVRSYTVYEAVLDHGIRTPEAFERYMAVELAPVPSAEAR
jgi:hypothetical protein